MSRKDYWTIAFIMQRLRDRADAKTWQWAVEETARCLKTDNPQLKVAKFYRACGHVPSKGS